MADRPVRQAAGPTPADWRQLDGLRNRWNAERVGAGRAPLPDDDQTRRLLALIWRDRQREGARRKGVRKRGTTTITLRPAAAFMKQAL